LKKEASGSEVKVMKGMGRPFFPYLIQMLVGLVVKIIHFDKKDCG